MNLRNTINKHALLFFLLIPIVSIGLHRRIFSTDLIGSHLWRQSQTEINIQNFYRHDFNIMNPRNNALNGDGNNIMRFEFPIMQWGVAVAHKVFGESITVTRISMFLIGLWGVLGIYFLLKWLWNDKIVALLGAWAFNFSPLFYYFTMNPFPDVFALCSTIWAIAFFFRYVKTEQKSAILVSATLLGIATLAKLPFVIFGSMVGIYVLQQWFTNGFKALKETIFLSLTYILLLLPAFFWYKWVIPTWGDNGVLMGIFSNEVPLSKTLEIFQFYAYEFLPKLLLNYAAVPFFCISLFLCLKIRHSRTEIGQFWPLRVCPLSFTICLNTT
jgi:4-amino-4-deoxy-L-arabinose transferase-like glycosyltransferase